MIISHLLKLHPVDLKISHSKPFYCLCHLLWPCINFLLFSPSLSSCVVSDHPCEGFCCSCPVFPPSLINAQAIVRAIWQCKTNNTGAQPSLLLTELQPTALFCPHVMHSCTGVPSLSLSSSVLQAHHLHPLPTDQPLFCANQTAVLNDIIISDPFSRGSVDCKTSHI